MSSGNSKRGPGKDEKNKRDGDPSSKENSPAGASSSSSKEKTTNLTATSNGGPSGEVSPSGSTSNKSVGEHTLAKDAAQRLLVAATRGEWPAVDQLLKTLEKAAQNQGEDGDTAPLAGLMDPQTGMTPLMYAVKDNRISLLDRMIELGADVRARNIDNFNALHLAAMYSREDVVKYLLAKKDVDVYATGGSKKRTAVHLVASRQSGTATSVLRALLTAADRNICLLPDQSGIDESIDSGQKSVRSFVRGKIPLHLAVEAGNQSMCKELLSQQASEQLKVFTPSGDAALHLAARRRDIDMMRILIDYGAPVDSQNVFGQTALHIASAIGDEALVKYLHALRASASITDHQDRTPMHLAAENGHTNIIELLHEKFKASIFERTKDGSTLMHIASLNGHSECATMLFKNGVYLHMPNKKGARSIHTAARYGHVGIISTLLQRGENVDAKTNDNYTPLHIAVESGKHDVVETLLGYGAEVHVRGGKLRETPLHIAARVPNGNKCTLTLLKSGANPNLATDDGQTPVHVAARHDNLATLELLLEDGGDPMFKSKNGETPLHLACKSCRASVVQHLIKFVKRKKNIDVVNYVNSLTFEGASALHYAAQIEPIEVAKTGDDRAVVKALIKAGADVSLQTKQAQDTPFHCCAQVGNNEVLSEMISHLPVADVGKALNRQNAMGWTPLLIAAHKGHINIVNNLLANQARVDVFDLEGRSALHLAAEHGYLKVCDSLLASRAFINSKSRVGRTALHLAAVNGNTDLVRFLVHDHNAAIDVLTLRKQTPLHLAAGVGQLKVCKLLLELGANINATDDQGQKPIHVAAMNNYADVVQLFLQQHENLVMAVTRDGNTCAHIAAMQGSVRVIEELMKFDRSVISVRNKLTGATPLQIAAEGGHAEVVKVLVRAGASCTDENMAGFTAVHLAAKHGHGQVLEVMRTTQSLRVLSKKLGVTALHVAAYFGQADTVRELLSHVPATVKSNPPTGDTLVGELGNESGMTPLHLASYSGNENVVRLLLNSVGVQVDAVTTENGYNSLHLACFGGHTTVVGLLLSRSAELLHSADRHGKTGLHIAATNGQYQMVEVLLGQGADINAKDKNGWTPLHCVAKAGHLKVVQLLVQSGASPTSKTNQGNAPIWFAASEGHNDVLKYLMGKKYDSYGLMDDKKFVYNLMVCSKSHKNKPIEDFILFSPAPVDTAVKLSSIYVKLSEKEKERSKDLIAAGKQCETMAMELLAIAAGADSAGRILTSLDRRNVEFLDVLIENEQKEVIAHWVVQRYLQELWRGSLNWNRWRKLLLFMVFVSCPPVWIVFALPLGHKYNNVPIIKFMVYLTSHIYLMTLLALVGIFPIYPVNRYPLIPYWYDWCLLIMLSGLLLFELTNPSVKSGLGWIKLAVLLFGIFGVFLHILGLFNIVGPKHYGVLLYFRNQLFALSFLWACVQIFDFLSFHYLFGPWAIIIGNLMKDLGRFIAVLAIFVFGFSMQFVALNQPIKDDPSKKGEADFPSVFMLPHEAVELLFFAIFGQKTHVHFITVPATRTEEWTTILFKFTFGIYMLVSVVVLINLLIAMMSDTYQKIQAQSDIEWKYGLSKLIRNMHRTTTAPSPLNLVTTWVGYLYRLCKRYKQKKVRPSIFAILGVQRGGPQLSARTKMGAKWLSKIKNTSHLTRKDGVPFPVTHLSPLDSQISFNNVSRIESVVDWDVVRRKYRELHGDAMEKPTGEKDEEQESQLVSKEDTFSRVSSRATLIASPN